MSDTPPLPNDKIPEHQTAAYRAARMAVIILSILIILALIALVVGGITHKSKTAPAGATATLALSKGARIVAMDSQPGRLILRVRDGDAEEIDILDTGDGHLVSQIKMASAP